MPASSAFKKDLLAEPPGLHLLQEPTSFRSFPCPPGQSLRYSQVFLAINLGSR